MENLRKMLMAMAKDVRVILIKICDRVHNIRTLEYQTPQAGGKKALETLEIYAPIAHRLGMQRMKWELEDSPSCTWTPWPIGTSPTSWPARPAAHATFMENIQEEITARLEQEGIHATVYGRIKHIYSIYRKMFTQNKTLEEIFDLFAFRVIVDDIPDCYNVLGLHPRHVQAGAGPFQGLYRHAQAEHVPVAPHHRHRCGRHPVRGPNSHQRDARDRRIRRRRALEVQAGPEASRLGTEDTFAWIRRLLENQEGTDPEDFVHTLKVDMFADEVFVFTPNGDVINLPAGATPIDFAYTIHSAVGNHMTGAKVNGRIVTFDYQRKSGDIVEVITSKSAKGPSRDWMKIAKSNEARSKIRQWFKREKRDENIANGRAMFESELKHLGLTIEGMLTTEEMLPQHPGEGPLQLPGGHVRRHRLRRGLRPEVRQPRPGRAGPPGPAAGGEAGRPAGRRRTGRGRAGLYRPGLRRGQGGNKKHSVSGVIVSGMTECMVKFAKSLHPVPGDPIVGFITRGATACPSTGGTAPTP